MPPKNYIIITSFNRRYDVYTYQRENRVYKCVIINSP